MKKILSLIVVVQSSLFMAQTVEISEKSKIDLPFVSSIYFGAAPSTTFRTLDSAKTAFGESLGYRTDEEKLKTWSFNGGYRSPINNFLTLDIGFNLNQSGEKYAYDDPNSDSTYTYRNRYRDFGIPIQVYASYGKSFRWFIGGGIQAHMAISYNQEIKYTQENGSPFESEKNSTEILNSLTFSAQVSGGFQWRWNKAISVYFVPSYVFGLSNQYAKQEAYVYKRRVMEWKFGLCYNLK